MDYVYVLALVLATAFFTALIAVQITKSSCQCNEGYTEGDVDTATSDSRKRRGGRGGRGGRGDRVYRDRDGRAV